MSRVIIIGAGLAGLSCAVTLAAGGRRCCLISKQPSERAQSVLAEGGINAALDLMGEGDTVNEHFEDTIKGGVYLADAEAVRGLTENAPETVMWLRALGVPFNTENGQMIQRPFGGQKKRRTLFAKSSSGKMIMSALIDEARKYESRGLIKRYPHHEMIRLLIDNGRCTGARVKDSVTGKCADFSGTVVMCTGGMNGMFPMMTTGTTQNTGDALAAVFMQGVRLSNLEMIQYHPTTIAASGKRCLVSEAARGEGGRLYILKDGVKYYFMEERHPDLKNLAPRDVVAREMYFVRRETGGQSVMLDMTALDGKTWKNKLPDLRQEVMEQLSLDPKIEPIPVKEGIHYFMGGIDVDPFHRTSLEGLYAAGECASIYHGANRLGGNSMLGAVYGGKRAAGDILQSTSADDDTTEPGFEEAGENESFFEEAAPEFIKNVSDILLDCLGIVRNEDTLKNSLGRLDELTGGLSLNDREKARAELAAAMIKCALIRRESRGAHYREDYPERDESLCTMTSAEVSGGGAEVGFKQKAYEGAVL